MFDDPHMQGHLPRPFVVFYETERACYEDLMSMQIEEVTAQRGKGDLDKLLRGKETLDDQLIITRSYFSTEGIPDLDGIGGSTFAEVIAHDPCIKRFSCVSSRRSLPTKVSSLSCAVNGMG